MPWRSVRGPVVEIPAGLSLLDLARLADEWREEYRRVPDGVVCVGPIDSWPPFVAVCQRAFQMGAVSGQPDPDEYVHRDDLEDADDIRSEGYSAALKDVTDRKRGRGRRLLKGRIGNR